MGQEEGRLAELIQIVQPDGVNITVILPTIVVQPRAAPTVTLVLGTGLRQRCKLVQM